MTIPPTLPTFAASRPPDIPSERARNQDGFQPALHTWQDQLKGAVVVLGTAAIGLGLGVYGGLGNGPLAGAAGALAGAAGGATLGCQLPGRYLLGGAVVGVLAGGILAASFGHPVLAAVLGISGATLPYAIMQSYFQS